MYDKPVKLYSTKNNTHLSDYYDYYISKDYYGSASQIAKKYCKAYPEADKETVYMAASEAAELYDIGGVKTGARFETVVQVKIRAALFALKKRKESESMAVTAEERAAMIADRAAGMSYGQIAEKYGRNESSVSNNLLNWKRAGLFPPEEPGSEEPAEEPEAVAENATTTEPGKPHPEAYPGQIYDEIPQAVKDRESKVEGKIRDYYAEKQPCLAVPNPFRRGVWEELSLHLTLRLCALLGLGAVCTARSYDEEESLFHAFIRDADGRKYKLKLEEIK